MGWALARIGFLGIDSGELFGVGIVFSRNGSWSAACCDDVQIML
jgi:hypothetical protein